jgi:hypothetical protein
MIRRKKSAQPLAHQQAAQAQQGQAGLATQNAPQQPR